MNEEKPQKIRVKTNKQYANSIVADARTEAAFSPLALHDRVKARFYRRLEEMSHLYDKAAAFKSPQIMEQLAGTARIHTWMEERTFAVWFLDQEFTVDHIAALQSKAVQVLDGLLEDDDLQPGDRIKVARTLLELGDMFPGKKSEVRFLDDRVNALSESETEKEIKQLQEKLAVTAEAVEEEQDV